MNGDGENGITFFTSGADKLGRVLSLIDNANGEYKAMITGWWNHGTGVAFQTMPGHAAQLVLGAFPDLGTEEGDLSKYVASAALATTAGFSVSAIPIAIEMILLKNPVQAWSSPVNPYVFRWGAQYKVVAISDSRDSSDLDEVGISENFASSAKADTSVGDFDQASNLPPDNNGYSRPQPWPLTLTAARARATAQELQAFAILRAMGSLPTKTKPFYQYFTFIDLRSTNATIEDQVKTPYVVLNSGFKISIVRKADDVVEVFRIPFEDKTIFMGSVQSGIMSKESQQPVMAKVGGPVSGNFSGAQ